jgi:hypothetical protein
MSNKREGEITPHQLQKRTGCHRNTAYLWCKQACTRGDGPLAGSVRQDVTGHYWIKTAAVDAILSKQSQQ